MTSRCLEHTIYLATGDLIKALGPKTKTWTRNRTASVEDVEDSDDEDEDVDWVADWNWLDLLSDEEAVDEEIEFKAGDTWKGSGSHQSGKSFNIYCVRSLSAFGCQIHASPQAKAFFAKCCLEEGIPVLELIKWIRMRWGSMHDLIERLLDCKAVWSALFSLDHCSLPLCRVCLSFVRLLMTNFILSALGASLSLESIAEDSRKKLRDYLESP